MFQYDIGATKHFTSKADGESAYLEFCKGCGIAEIDFPFTVKTGRKVKGREILFTCTSWGSYLNASNQWVVFVAYYAPLPKHTSQYSWNVDANGKITGVPRQYGFIN